jgi:hypothetical protein
MGTGYMPRALWGILMIGSLFGWSSQAQASSFKFYTDTADEASATSFPNQTDAVINTEIDIVNTAFDLFTSEQAMKGLEKIGQPKLSGRFPVANLPPGVPGFVQFQFIDPVTRSPLPDTEINFVTYEVKLSHGPDSSFSVLGSSNDLESNFLLPFVYTVGFEPTIRATPFDFSGNPIFIPGVDDQNVAVGEVFDIPALVPEPSTLLLLSLLLPFLFVGWRRRTNVG